MSLPKLRVPEYFTTLPTIKKEVKYRPWLVGEQKILLSAIESNNNKEIFNAIYRIIDACLLDDTIEVSKLPSPDMEWLFIKLREVSVGSIIDIKIKHEEDGKEFDIPLKINLADVKLTEHKQSPNIVLEEDNGIGVVLKYPTLEMMQELSKEHDSEDGEANISQTEITFNIIEKCIDKVFDENEVYEDLPSDYVKELLNTMNEQQRLKVMEFFSNVPTAYLEIEYTNPVTNEPHKTTLNGITDFFI